MKLKHIILIVLSLVIIFLVGYFVYNIYFKEEIVEVNFEVAVYSDTSLLDFQDKIQCNLKDDNKIDTSKVQKYQMITHCRNSEKKKYKYLININVVDKESPRIILKDSYSVTEGYDKKLTDVIISADNYDSKPKREIIGVYDFNKVGSYNLTYKVTDNSGNISTKDFVLYVNEKKPSVPSNSFIAFSDIVKNHKNKNTKIGIDVSKWQGNIDFEKVKNAGAEFVMIRIGHQDGFGGEYIIDPYFKKNIEKATEVGLDVGIYFYSYADSHEQAKRQVNWILENLKGYQINMPIVYDWESWSNFNSLNLSLFEFNEIANTFLAEIEKNKYSAMLYSSKNYLENIWNINEYKTWLAHYTDKTNYEGDYYMWQLCSDGKISGINGYVDINVLYK